MANFATPSVLSETEYDMVKHIIEIPVLEELELSECSIYKVPCKFWKVNKESYTPQLISIGPIHFGKDELKQMQGHKQIYFHFFWERVSNEHAMKNYKLYLETNEQDIRQCYAEKFPEIGNEKFADMMLLDAVFIMELLLRNSYWKSDRSMRDYKLTMLIKDITRDLILLENQIPFFVLNKLYETVVPDEYKKQEHTCFVDLALEYFSFYDTQRSSSSETKMVLDMNKHRCKNYLHFTDLIRFCYLPTNQLRKYDCSDSFLRTATKLQESGVSFEKDLKKRLLDITFDKKLFLSSFLCLGCLPSLNYFKARFRIPQLKVDRQTECVLRNLMAFEHFHYPEQPYIHNYVSLFGSLIQTKDDVELLVEKEVIVHELGNYKEVATIVNGLSKRFMANPTYYHELINELNKHYQNPWNHTMAALWLVYFRDPWRASSTVVGIAVLIFAVFNFLRDVRHVF